MGCCRSPPFSPLQRGLKNAPLSLAGDTATFTELVAADPIGFGGDWTSTASQKKFGGKTADFAPSLPLFRPDIQGMVIWLARLDLTQLQEFRPDIQGMVT